MSLGSTTHWLHVFAGKRKPGMSGALPQRARDHRSTYKEAGRYRLSTLPCTSWGIHTILAGTWADGMEPGPATFWCGSTAFPFSRKLFRHTCPGPCLAQDVVPEIRSLHLSLLPPPQKAQKKEVRLFLA